MKAAGRKLDFGGQKLLHHLDRVAAWQRGEAVTPIIYEMSLTDACNSRCRMCHIEVNGRRNIYFPQDVLGRLPEELAEAGTKAVYLAGEGEPLLHPGIAKFCAECRGLGVETAVSSNGIAFAGEAAESLLESLTWVRFTVLSFSSGYYEKLAAGGDHSRAVHNNIRDACRERTRRNLSVTIGVQQMLFDENMDDIVPQCRAARELGADYFVLVPGVTEYGGVQMPMKYGGSYEAYSDLLAKCLELSTDSFHVSPEDRLTQRRKGYDRCLGFSFVSRIYSDGLVVPCLRHRGREETALGDLKEQALKEIWRSERARRILAELSRKEAFKDCRYACRANMTNKFLFNISNPPAHVNFI